METPVLAMGGLSHGQEMAGSIGLPLLLMDTEYRRLIDTTLPLLPLRENTIVTLTDNESIHFNV